MFDRLLFSRARRKFATEGWNFRTRDSVRAFQYSRTSIDDNSRADHVLRPPWRPFHQCKTIALRLAYEDPSALSRVLSSQVTYRHQAGSLPQYTGFATHRRGSKPRCPTLARRLRPIPKRTVSGSEGTGHRFNQFGGPIVSPLTILKRGGRLLVDYLGGGAASCPGRPIWSRERWTC
jgi:hypothetical protein